MDIHESMTDILNSEEILGDLFYKGFLTSYPKLMKYFEGVNMQAQAAMLTTALVVIERFYALESVAVEKYLRVLGTRHCDRNIPKEAYADWKQAMLDTLEKFHDADWSDELATQWRMAIDRAIECMLQGYEQHYHV